MYTFNSRIRYSEVDYQAILTLQSLLDYFQDCSTFQAEDLGVGLAFTHARSCAWVLNMWQIDIERYPVLGERITVGTSPYDMRGFLGYRNFAMFDEAGKRVAVANTLWTMLDLKKGKPMLVPKKIAEAYEIEEKMKMEYLPRKIAIPENGVRQDEIKIGKGNLDSNRHVNNGQYVRMAMEFIPDDYKINRVRVEYKEQAFLDDVIIPVVYRNENSITVALNKKEKETYAIVELIT